MNDIVEKSSTEKSDLSEFLEKKKDELIATLDTKKIEFIKDTQDKLAKLADETISSKQTTIIAINNSLAQINQDIEKYQIDLNGSSESLASLKNKVQLYKSENEKEIEAFATKAKEKVTLLDESIEEAETLKNKIDEQYQSIFGHTVSTRKYITADLEAKIEETNDGLFFEGNKIIKMKNIDEPGKRYFYTINEKKPGVIDELKKRQEEYDSNISLLNSQIDKKMSKLETDINDFISAGNSKHTELFSRIQESYESAIAVGLSKAYKIAKDAHKKSLNIWSIVLVVSICSMLFIPFLLEYYFIKNPIAGLDTLLQVLKRIFSYLPFISPMVFLSYIASKNMNGYRRLYEEYLYKESLSLTYEGLKKEIEDLEKDAPNKILLEQLLSQTLVAAKSNPSIHLDPIDGEMYIDMLANVIKAKSIKISGGTFFRGAKIEFEDILKEVVITQKEEIKCDEDEEPQDSV
jgi:hypothetical protein